MSKYINSETVLGTLELICNLKSSNSITFDDIKNVFDMVKDANIEEIVRCKDCFYGHQFFEIRNGETDCWVECNMWYQDVSHDGYCYRGVRRDV